MRDWLRIFPAALLGLLVAGLSQQAAAAPPTSPTPTPTVPARPSPKPTTGAVPGVPQALVEAVHRDLGHSWDEFARQGLAASRAGSISQELSTVPGFNDVRLESGIIVATGQGPQFRRAAAVLQVPTREIAPGISPTEAADKLTDRLGADTVVSSGHGNTGAILTVDEAAVSEAQRREAEQSMPGRACQMVCGSSSSSELE